MAQPPQPKSIRPAATSRPAASANVTAKAKATTQKGKQEQGVKTKISKESQSLLNAALADSSSLQGQKGPLDEDDALEDEPVRKQQRRKHEATVPPRVSDKASRKFKTAREDLPSFQFRSQILEAISKHPVIVIQGETGCGKTTQVGQFIVEDAAEKGTPCSVVCTQPRRLSAIAVAGRVADERGEMIGATIGYSVKNESKARHNTHLLFCTTGILLRRLENDGDLAGTTHVVVDEVHERGVESDFLLLALRDISSFRKDLKIVLMSATMDKDLFGRYFENAPGIEIPGRTFTVQHFFLEDALQITKHVVDPNADWAKGKGTQASKGKDHDDARKLEDMSQVQSRYGKYHPRVQDALRAMDQDAVNYDLLVSVIEGTTLQDLAKSEEGDVWRPTGVLVFLSGVKEIETAQQKLLSLPEFQEEPARSWVLPLHGGMPTDEQNKVFERAPTGVRKIVLSTNVAETSVTIDAIGFVVDTCRMKEMRFDAVRRMLSLEDTVVSRANARQRSGRAGRVAPGVAVHLGLTRHRHDQKVDDHQKPEVLRVPLEQLILRIHATGMHQRDTTGKAASVCARLLEPPDHLAVKKSVEELVRLGALKVDPETERESLTPLGKHLVNLPLDISLGKLVLYGCAFGPAATDAALTVAAALTSRNPFVKLIADKHERKEEADKMKKNFADKMVEGPIGPSDHLAVLRAYNEWDALPRAGKERQKFCSNSYLNMKTLQEMSETKRSLLETLSEVGFAGNRFRAKDVANLGLRFGNDGVLRALDPRGTCKPCPPVLVSALLCTALFPKVATARIPKTCSATEWTPKFDLPDAENGSPIEVKIDRESVCANESIQFLSVPYLVYQQLQRCSDYVTVVRDVTPVTPLALALFGGQLAIDANTPDTLTVGGWIKLTLPSKFHAPLLEIRRRLDTLLERWVAKSGEDCGEAHQEMMADSGGTELLSDIVELISKSGLESEGI